MFRKLSCLLLVPVIGFVGGCPLTPSEPPASAVLEGEWTGDTEDNVALVVTFDANGVITRIVATNADGSGTINVNGATTELDGTTVTITIPAGDRTATYDATLSADGNTMAGSITSEIDIGDGDLTIIITPGDLTLTRTVEAECEADADCADGEVCTDGECVAGPGGCTGDADCGEGEVCTDGECVAAPLVGDPVAGETYYVANACGACHGADATGGSGPSLVDSSAQLIFDKLSGAVSHDGPTYDVTMQDATDVEAYIASIQ